MMQKTIDLLQEQLVGIHSGTLNAGIVDTIRIDYYGQKIPLKQIASVTQKSRTISILLYDLQSIENIISTLTKNGFNAFKFSKQEIIINAPEASGEESQKTFNRISKLGEEAKISIRNIRKNYRNKLTKEDRNTIIDDTTKEFVGKIKHIVKSKIESLRRK